MTHTTAQDLLAFAIDVAGRAGAATLAHFQSAIQVDIKDDNSPVTVADREAEQIMRTMITARYPDDAVVGEEFGTSGGNARRRWIIDPIDGTRSFIRGVPLYGVMVGVEENGVMIAGVLHFPALRETVAAARGCGCTFNGAHARVSECTSLADALILTTDTANIERVGFADSFERVRNAAGTMRTWGDCYGYALVATGRAEAMFDPIVSPWDVAALVPIIEEAGGVITSWNGDPAWPCDNVVATNAALAHEIRASMRSAAACEA